MSLTLAQVNEIICRELADKAREEGQREVVDAMRKCLDGIQGQISVWGPNVSAGDAMSEMFKVLKRFEKRHAQA